MITITHCPICGLELSHIPYESFNYFCSEPGHTFNHTKITDDESDYEWIKISFDASSPITFEHSFHQYYVEVKGPPGYYRVFINGKLHSGVNKPFVSVEESMNFFRSLYEVMKDSLLFY